jgi:hypothetical protein
MIQIQIQIQIQIRRAAPKGLLQTINGSAYSFGGVLPGPGLQEHPGGEPGTGSTSSLCSALVAGLGGVAQELVERSLGVRAVGRVAVTVTATATATTTAATAVLHMARSPALASA